jgi:Subtilisin inhibitor-like
LLAAACGSSAGDEGSDDAAAEPTPVTELTITLWPRGRDGESFETTLTCDPAEGTHPSPEAACSALAADREALEPVPPDVACTLIFGGPERATVVGVLDGADVDAAFERSKGCEIDRWDRVAPLLQIRPALR